MSLIKKLADETEGKLAIKEILESSEINKRIHELMGLPLKVKRWVVIAPEIPAAISDLKSLEEANAKKKDCEAAGHKCNDPVEYEEEGRILEYCMDLNACYRMEQWIKERVSEYTYMNALEAVVCPDGIDRNGYDSSDLFAMTHATPPERCQAFLRAFSTVEKT